MSHNTEIAQGQPHSDVVPDLREIVMGVHWDPPQEDGAVHPEDLDALCILLDEAHRVLEVIHPGHPRNANGSIVHTGDSRTGASEWDDERIFVFLEALPAEVSSLVFIVSSATGRAFREIRGACCHVSDHATEHKWVGIELTALGNRATHCIAAVHRSPTGWKISLDAQAVVSSGCLQELLSLAASVKWHGAGPISDHA